ncbi:MAG: NAD(P)H-hydrate dehydratase [Dichotomicrobium sp.]
MTTEEMIRAEKLAMENGTSSLILMENAGNGVAEDVVKRFARGTKVVVLCGPGRNGGDGFVAARRLRERGYHIRLALLGDKGNLPSEAQEMAKRWDEAIEPMTPECLDGAQLIIDAIFGSGLKDEVRDVPAQMIEDVTKRNLPVVAVDMPTGIDATSGQVRGTAFKAVSTVSFYRRKTGQVLYPGRTYCGDVTTVDIGIPASVMKEVGPRAFSDQPELWLKYYPRIKLTGHKYDRGHAVVVSGEMERTGAARLGARAALRMGAGLVSLASSKSAFYINAAQVTSIMVDAFDGPEGLADLLSDQRITAIMIGPGAGITEETQQNVSSVLGSTAAAVIDADGLTAFEEDPSVLFDQIKYREPPVILTPHDGEFARLFPELMEEPSKLERARAAAEMSGAVVVLKGPDTVIAAPNGVAGLVENAPPLLATAGTGDVLAGIVTGLLAQGMDALDAAMAGVWIHGETAREIGPGMISEDMSETLPLIIRRLDERADLFSGVA